MKDESLTAMLVPDHLWMVVEERLHHQHNSPVEISRAVFGDLQLCLAMNFPWSDIPDHFNDSGADMALVFATCTAAGVWDALLNDADVTGDTSVHTLATVAKQRARRDANSATELAAPAQSA